MGWLLSSVYDRLIRPMEEAGVAAWRAHLLGGLRGDVLEVGAGTGLNLPHYPVAVNRLTLAEPDRHMRRRLERRLRASARGGAETSDAALPRLPFDGERFDGVVATLLLCSVRDPAASLGEIARVLKPGGVFVFLEHVAADEHPRRLKWQRRIEPIWKRVFDGCHLTRRTADAIVAAGFVVDSLVREDAPRAAPLVRSSIRGVARKP